MAMRITRLEFGMARAPTRRSSDAGKKEATVIGGPYSTVHHRLVLSRSTSRAVVGVSEPKLAFAAWI